jgi:SAM-dependent methyltransferase
LLPNQSLPNNLLLKALLKNILQKLGCYHFLQGNYRQVLFFLKKLISKNKYAKFKGAGFTCNCCGARYSTFMPDHPSAQNSNAIAINKVIAGYGNNIVCPACLSTARERLIIALLEHEIKLTGKKILHLSPEKNIYNFIKPNNEVVTADIQPLFYKKIDHTIKAEDATRFSFADESFDAVIGNHIMEHIPDDSKALSEIYRVLKPGGRAILQVPYSVTITHTIEVPAINDPQQQAALFGQKDHVRIYRLNDYINRLQHCGFKVTVREYQDLAAYYKNAIQHDEAFLSILK